MNEAIDDKPTLSVIIPVGERYDPVSELFHAYRHGLEATGLDYEIIYVLDGRNPSVLESLQELQKTHKLCIVTLAKRFGDATALNAGFSKASGDLLLTLTAYQQIEAEAIPKLTDALLEGNCDMALARRWPRTDSPINRLQTRAFSLILGYASDLKLHDAGCGARAFTRKLVDEVQVYGDLHRFYPILADRQGFRVIEVDAKQAANDAYHRVYSPGVYLRRLLDVLTVFFLVKFTKRPLRFFGLVGASVFTLGALATLYLVFERVFFGVALADRPALILSSLLVVLGVQIVAIGLIGEIIIFTHAREIKEYTIEDVINYDDPGGKRRDS